MRLGEEKNCVTTKSFIKYLGKAYIQNNKALLFVCLSDPSTKRETARDQ